MSIISPKTPLIISSCFFFIPAVWSLVLRQYYLTTAFCIVSCVSINYWRKPICGFRHNLDLIVSKLAFVMACTTRCMYYYNHLQLDSSHTCSGDKKFDIGPFEGAIIARKFVLDSTILLFTIHCYQNSQHKYRVNDNIWILYHMMFHLVCSMELVIIVLQWNGDKILILYRTIDIKVLLVHQRIFQPINGMVLDHSFLTMIYKTVLQGFQNQALYKQIQQYNVCLSLIS